ncbi:carbamoyltransferase HypF [Aliarcobacter butzleri]|uniref:carbamoyltransferase HypF n=2 Tax=Aliarcobacter butzleri TaxID=28197 RepID=UPI001EDE5796|nr:carbamoyltransferase HypF [Aliarcobacter butzleri]MCG3674226.1 carbamoyltransferase HypF [Aliarcobacter butzleri]MCT7548996.1 carbamoyltransferase HypF [Aliarcobacter butzleri]MCT7558307.1 carbamoyltransferase HypF [Aliarcobacter butzleri]MDN5081013.1 carbamoyltransferase HypF [Aliarcobacter butzleri]MDN5082181.1 carbamoyltransferase HypF [Aliarcobacter butzleri]
MINKKISIFGIVQGVGFRPFIYNLAIKYDIKGWVKNDENGVEIEAYSTQENIENFINEIKLNPPVLAKITNIKIEKNNQIKEYKNFEIIQSSSSKDKTTIISPDIAICDDCIKDIDDIGNFRYNYSLTNCTNCGPRYSIIKTVPYDRANTSMNDFKLCKKCEDEYKNPLNRRYHAQPVACEDCGPNMTLYNINNGILSYNINAIEQTANLIKDGYIIAVKGIGGFHIVCDATNDKVVNKLREIKNRPNKPFAVMFNNINSIKQYTNMNSQEEEILTSKEKPIVLVKKRLNTNLSSYIAPNISKLGCFIANCGIHHLLFKYLQNPIVATSANLKDEPIIRSKDEIIGKLGNIVDFVLDYNRDIVNSSDDSIIQNVENYKIKLRNARGYAPTHIKIEKDLKNKVLCLGANQKSTIALGFKNNFILSPYIGDLNSISSMEYFNRTINSFKNFYDFVPDTVVCDLHPKYESTKYAFKLLQDNPNIKLIQIQHHYAHILSVMAENGLEDEVLGFAFDGTGYGDDGNIWGGEVFIASRKEYKRINHIKYFKLLGGEMAIKEPKRVALSFLFDIFTLDEILALDSFVVKAFSKEEIKTLYTMWQKGLNAPFCSSIGRLFDAISSFSNILHTQTFEGETGLLIEENYDNSIKDNYEYKILDENIDITPMIRQIIEDKDKKVISSKFINTLVNIIIEISNKHKNLPVVFSGGVFQNKTLLELLIKKFKEQGRVFYFNIDVPTNDEGISIGQLYYQYQ